VSIENGYSHAVAARLLRLVSGLMYSRKKHAPMNCYSHPLPKQRMKAATIVGLLEVIASRGSNGLGSESVTPPALSTWLAPQAKTPPSPH
jgi:hypothetical protein